MRALALALLLLPACSGEGVSSAHELVCGWALEYSEDTPASSAPGLCIAYAPANEWRATTRAGADACAVRPGVRVYQPKQSIQLWTRVGNPAPSGIDVLEVPCP